MDIQNYLDKKSILLNFDSENKKTAITTMISHLVETGKIEKKNKRKIVSAVLRREEMGSTAIGGYIALPHARVEGIKDLVLCLAISPTGIDFNSLDAEPVYIIALLLSPQAEAGTHLKMLAYLARILKDKYFVQELRSAKSANTVIGAIKRQQALKV